MILLGNCLDVDNMHAYMSFKKYGHCRYDADAEGGHAVEQQSNHDVKCSRVSSGGFFPGKGV